MITHKDALSLILDRIDLDTLIDEQGHVHLSGQWQLHELEALCIVLRDRLGPEAKGAEEVMIAEGHLQSIMPMERLQAIVRDHYNRVVRSIARTMMEDLCQTINPGSTVVYGKLVKEGVAFSSEATRTIAIDELPQILNEMMQTLDTLGCSRLTQVLAQSMLLSMIWLKDQEEFLSNEERILKDPT